MKETEQEKQSKMDLNSKEFWAINERSDIGIPAVELDIVTGTHNVLVWTSKEAALRYCYQRNPSAAKNIYQVPRRTRKDASGKVEVLQVGLLKIARRLMMSKLENVTHFVIDHPGTPGGLATYLAVEDMAYLGRKPVPKDIRSAKDLKNFLDAVENDD